MSCISDALLPVVLHCCLPTLSLYGFPYFMAGTVQAARDLGYEFVSRTNDSITIKVAQQLLTYEVWDVMIIQ